MRKKQSLVWRPERRKVSELVVWKRNPRKISKEAFAKLKERIRERGFHDVLKIDTDGTVLSGNQRKKALLDLGITEVTVLLPNRRLTEEEKDLVALESNSNDGEWDYDLLKSFKLDTLADIGFSASELESIWKENIEVTDDDFDELKELRAIKIPKTKLGDLIQLGPHRLICGSCNDSSVIKRLFGKEQASIIYCDPPYNIQLDYSSGIGGKKNYGGNVNDTRSYEEYKSFIGKSIETALSVAKRDAHIFYWCDQTYIGLLQGLYRDTGIDNKRVCLWLKNAQNPTPGVAFNKCYEPCVYGIKGKPYIAKNLTSLNEVMNKETETGNALLEQTLDHLDVWAVKRLSGKDYEHATSKPPKLHEKAIRRCTKPGDIILDSFMGSGSTLIAAEQLKRRAYGCELEPIFCDLIIRRFERLTGIKAKILK